MPDKTDDREKPSPAGELKKTDQDISRQEKTAKLIEAGVDLFPYRTEHTHSVFEVVRDFAALTPAELEDKKNELAVPGRILSVRKMGRTTFATISDSRAKVQVYLREDRVGEKAYRTFSLLDIGDIIGVRGTLFKTRTGELTVLVGAYELLAKCQHPLPKNGGCRMLSPATAAILTWA
jgi:lysyl-tRNA synthetase class 2